MSYDVIHCLVQTGEVDGDGSPIGNVLPAEEVFIYMDRCYTADAMKSFVHGTCIYIVYIAC